MGKRSSKHLTLQHLQEQQVTGGANNVDENKQDAQIQTKPDYENLLYQVHGSGSTDQNENLSVQGLNKMGKSSSKQAKLHSLEEKRVKKHDAENSNGKYQDVQNDSEYKAFNQEARSTNGTARPPLAEKVTNDYETDSRVGTDEIRSDQEHGVCCQGTFNDGSSGEFEAKGQESEPTEAYENILVRAPDKGRDQHSEEEINAYAGRLDCKAVLSVRRHYRELKRRVWIESVCDYLIQEDVLLQREFENIMHSSYPRHARVDILLQIMLRKKSQKAFKVFCLALRNTDCHDLADKLENTEGIFPEKPYIRDWSSKEILNAWPSIDEYLMEELLPEYIIDYFMQENIFSLDEYEEVFQYTRRMMMTKSLLEKMKTKLPEGFFVLLNALEDVDKENKHIVEVLEKLITTGKYTQEASENCREKQSDTSVLLVTVDATDFSAAVPLSTKVHYTVEVSVKKEGIVMEKVEVEIDKYMNNTDSSCLLQIFLPLTGCEITKSERGCVIVHLRPHSEQAFDKLSEFCKNGELKNFVLNLLREKNIFSTLPAGELCIDIQVQYHKGELKAEDTYEPETDLIKVIKDNWSFLCEELDVKNLISGAIEKTVFTDHETTELERRASKNRREAAHYFLTCLLNKGPTGIKFLMNALKEKNNMKIINRLQKSDPLYQNPQAIKENLLLHFELIVQEIDPSQFKDTFVDRKILDIEFFTDLREKHLSRRYRAVLFLKEVLNKGNRAIYAFVDVMTEMGCVELIAKLVSVKDNLLVPKQQGKDDRKEDVLMEVSNGPSPGGLIWSCCLKVNVEKKAKDERKQQLSGTGSEKEEPLYVNLGWDEGIGEAEDELSVTLRSKKSMGQKSRPVTHPESSLSHYTESVSDKSLTYPRTKESEEAKKSILSLITSVKDSGIDINVSKQDTFSTLRNIDSTS